MPSQVEIKRGGVRRRVALTPSTIGLHEVNNYPIATQAEAEAASSNQRYMTPLRVMQLVTDNAVTEETDPTVPGWVKAITAGDIDGWDEAYGWGDHSLAGYIKNISGFDTGDLTEGSNLYFTDPRAIDAIQGDPSWKAPDWNTAYGWGDHGEAGYASNSDFTTHTGNTSNPHSVTKSQVSLGSVENYGIASQAEAEAGSSNEKYMTPLRVLQSINDNSPEGVTTLAALTDVDVTGVGDGNFLEYDGTAEEWVVVGAAPGSTPWTTDGDDIYYDVGNVGIGTTSPDAPLHISSTISTIIQLHNTDSGRVGNVISYYTHTGTRLGYVGWGSTNNDELILNSDSGTLRFRSNNTDAMWIDTSQRVGIGKDPNSNWTVDIADGSDGALALRGKVWSEDTIRMVSSNFDEFLHFERSGYGTWGISPSSNHTSYSSNASLIFVYGGSYILSIDSDGSLSLGDHTLTGTNTWMGFNDGSANTLVVYDESSSSVSTLRGGSGLQIQGDSSNTSWTSNAGGLSIKKSNSAPYLSFHANGGARQAYIQSSSSFIINQENNAEMQLRTNGTVRMTIYGGGTTDFGNNILRNISQIRLNGTSSTRYIAYEGANISIFGDGSNDDYLLRVGESTGRYTASGDAFLINRDGYSIFVRHPTISGVSANTFLGTSGFINRITSSIRYKTNVRDLSESYPNSLEKVMQMRPVTFEDINHADGNQYIGVIAEDMINVSPELVLMDNGVPESVHYDRIPMFLISAFKQKIQNDEEIISSLTQRIEQLEQQINEAA